MKALFVALLLVCAAAAQAAPLTITDDIGRSISLPHAPQRIISLAPSVTEILFAVGAGSKLVADTTYCDYPAAALRLPHLNGLDPSRELLIGLSPDLIILSDQTMTRAKADSIQSKLGFPVYITAPADYVGVERDIVALGALAGSQSATEAVVRSMIGALHSVRRAVAGKPEPQVFYVIWDNPLMTAGRGSFIGSLIALAGGTNVAANTATSYPTYSIEQLVHDNPDILLTGSKGVVVTHARIPSFLTLNLTAVKRGQVIGIPEDWTVRPGPRLAQGLIAIARALHPGAFAK